MNQEDKELTKGGNFQNSRAPSIDYGIISTYTEQPLDDEACLGVIVAIKCLGRML